MSSDFTILHQSLTFGLTGAPGEYGAFGGAIQQVHAAHRPVDAGWEDVTPFHSFVLVDDQVIIEPNLGLRAATSVWLAEWATRKLLGPNSINAEKDEEEGRLETQKIIWGIHYDTVRAVVSLPAVKLEKASYLLHLPEFDYGNRDVPLRLVQELRGNQQFWMTVLPQLSLLAGTSVALLGSPSENGRARPKGTPVHQARAWLRFWDAVDLQRVLVDTRDQWASRFAHPMLGALSVAEVLALPEVRGNVVWASGDATPSRLGAVDWTSKVAFGVDVAPYLAGLRAMVAQADAEALEACPEGNAPTWNLARTWRMRA